MNRTHSYLVVMFTGLILPLQLHAHQDRYYKFQENNIVVRIKTGYMYEEVNKARLLTRMANDLVESLGYCNNVQIDFIHNYTYNRFVSDFFVSYKKSKVIQVNEDKYLSKNVNNARIVLRCLSYKIVFEQILKRLEASIKNEKIIREHQSQYQYDDGYNRWKIYSISKNEIDEIMSHSSFKGTTKVLDNKYYLGDQDGQSYFVQGGKFHFFQRSSKEVNLTTKDLFQYTLLGDHLFVVETPCLLHILSNKGVYSISEFNHCEEAWMPFKFTECPSLKYRVNYSPDSSSKLQNYYEGHTIEINLSEKLHKTVSSIKCE